MASEGASAIGHASSWGYACFLTVNATSVWGGIFPFLPLEFQTVEVTLVFFLAQAVAFGGAFLASMLGSYYFPYGARRMLVSLSAILLFLGSACLIAAMYVASATLLLVGAGGVLLGVGCAGMFMLWQRYFASLDARQGNFRLIVGTAIAPFIYFALYLVPIALTAFLVPLIFVPLCGLCVALSVREMNFEQPMFEDVPRQHPRVYRQAVADYWRSALCVGSLAFASGVIRGVALLHEEISSLVNSASMLGALLSAVVLLVLWHRMSFRFGLISVFRVAYPLLITGFLLLPFCGPIYLNAFAAVAYMVFSLVQMLMMMQCAQVSRDRGINPVFIYGFFGAVAYILQSLGFLFGWASDLVVPTGSQWLYFVAIIASYGLGLTLLVSTGTLVRPLVTKGAVDVMLDRTVLGPGEREEIERVNQTFSNQGLRVLAFACRRLESTEVSLEEENNMLFLGLIAMMDPPRAESKEAVAHRIAAGIRPIMITGDHVVTASAIAREIADVTIAADSLRELVLLKSIANGLQKRTESNYRFIMSFNSTLIVLGAMGILPPATSALLHNASTLGVSLKSMTNLLD